MAKTLRNTYPLGKNAMEEYIQFVESRGKFSKELKQEELSGSKMDFGYILEGNKMVAAWYDVLEMLDLYEVVELPVEIEIEDGDGR